MSRMGDKMMSRSNYPKNGEDKYEVKEPSTGKWTRYEVGRDPWHEGNSELPPYTEGNISTLRLLNVKGSKVIRMYCS